MKFRISTPEFECDKDNPELRFAYWEGHRMFAYDFVAFMQPETILELGSQYGCSLFTFCQSIKDHDLNTKISAVDAWSGDIGAEIPGEEVYHQVQNILAKRYSFVQTTLYQMYFKDALENFADNSIDIIHIDGGHTFEDVDRDFRQYLPKLKENGVMLFHDTNSSIDQGSCEHWDYLKQEYKICFEFEHSMGLGILFPKGDLWYKRLQEAGFFNGMLELYKYKATSRYYENRFHQLEGLYEERYHIIEEQSEMIRQRDEANAAQAKLLEERYMAIDKLSKMNDNMSVTLLWQGKIISTKWWQFRKRRDIFKQWDMGVRK